MARPNQPLYLLMDLNQVTTQVAIQLVLQRSVAILLQVQTIILQFKYRAAMALVVLLHLQLTPDLTTHHLLARHNLLHQILTMVHPNLTKIIMVLPLVVQSLVLPSLSLTHITLLRRVFLIPFLIHTAPHPVL